MYEVLDDFWIMFHDMPCKIKLGVMVELETNTTLLSSGPMQRVLHVPKSEKPSFLTPPAPSVNVHLGAVKNILGDKMNK